MTTKNVIVTGLVAQMLHDAHEMCIQIWRTIHFYLCSQNDGGDWEERCKTNVVRLGVGSTARTRDTPGVVAAAYIRNAQIN